MPNSVSSKKRLRQSLVRRDSNRAVKSTIKTQLKKVVAVVPGGDKEKTTVEVRPVEPLPPV